MSGAKEFWFNFRFGDKESVSQEVTVWCMKNGQHDFHAIEREPVMRLLEESLRALERSGCICAASIGHPCATSHSPDCKRNSATAAKLKAFLEGGK